MKLLSRVWLFATPWTVAYQALPSIGFFRQECWSGLSFPSPGDLPNPGIEPGSPALQADALPSEPPGKPFLVYGVTYFLPTMESEDIILTQIPESPKHRQSQFPWFTSTQCAFIPNIVSSMLFSWLFDSGKSIYHLAM